MDNLETFIKQRREMLANEKARFYSTDNNKTNSVQTILETEDNGNNNNSINNNDTNKHNEIDKEMICDDDDKENIVINPFELYDKMLCVSDSGACGGAKTIVDTNSLCSDSILKDNAEYNISKALSSRSTKHVPKVSNMHLVKPVRSTIRYWNREKIILNKLISYRSSVSTYFNWLVHISARINDLT